MREGGEMMKGKILIIDDEKLIGWSLQKDLTKDGYEAVAVQSAKEGWQAFEEQGADTVLLDIRLPDGSGKDLLGLIRTKDPQAAVIMVTANDDVRTAVECMQAGAFTYLHKPFDYEELRLNVEKAIEARHLRLRLAGWESRERGKYDFDNIIAESPAMKKVIDLLRRIVDSDASTVLLEGESGTGKDLIAGTIHYAGRRGCKSFVAINCAAIPATLLESELFGHEKGAFTDARQVKKGLVEEASGGTLFLDEVGDMPKDLQAKLLHLIDQKKFRKVGGLREIDADIRIIAATNKDIKEEVTEGRFREDLFYRLHVIPVHLAPLRERKEDIPPLLSFFIAHFNREFRKAITGISPEALEILKRYDWPGNVRELKNVIERAMILNKGTMIYPEHLPSEINRLSCRQVSAPSARADEGGGEIPEHLVGIPLEQVEKNLIARTLEVTNGNQSQAAKLLGIGRDALRYKMQKFGMLSAGE
jgi:DNA-binding NtrC family response regulator